MTAAKIFNLCRAKQIALSVEDGMLRAKDLNGVRLEMDLIEKLAQWKAELLELLHQEANDSFVKPYINFTKVPPELNIPSTESHPRYRWWADGQDLEATLRELNAPEEMLERYVQHYKKSNSNNRRPREVVQEGSVCK